MATRLRELLPGMLFTVLALLGASAASAAPILYGDFGPDLPGITIYQGVQEDSYTDPGPPGMFNAPSLSGNVLDFDPSAFAASGLGGGLDITNVQLNFTLVASEGGVESLRISESGDFSLIGIGTAVTSATAGVSVLIDILEVDGSAVAPIQMFGSISLSRDMAADGPVILAPWNLSLLMDFVPVLVANNIDFQFGVTRAEIAIDNQLTAISELNSVSFISKKDFKLLPVVREFPVVAAEPSTALLLAPFLLLLPRLRTRRA